jgi:AmmeMemoRadiSam system protein A
VIECPADRGAALLGLARAALVAAVRGEAAPQASLDSVEEEWLLAPGASFVTLRSQGELRGCIGCLEPRRPLVEDVRANARAAALEDRRFHPVRQEELGEISLEVSVLLPLEELEFADEAELLSALRPGVDGVVIECDGRRATFLPQVWDSLPDKTVFLEQLRLKAGLPKGFWSDRLRAWRYSVEKFKE